jgi:MFS superfamily sulfate permease-like transporter
MPKHGRLLGRRDDAHGRPRFRRPCWFDDGRPRLTHWIDVEGCPSADHALGKDSKSGRFHNRDDEGIDVRQDISVIGFGAVPFFANAETLKDPVVADVEERHPSAVVIDVGTITNIDTAAADELMKLRAELASRDVMLAFARLSGPARQALLSAGLDMNDRDFGHVEGAVEALANQ